MIRGVNAARFRPQRIGAFGAFDAFGAFVPVAIVATVMGLVNAGDRYRTGRPVFTGQPFTWWGVTWPYLVRAWIWAGLYPAVAALCRRWPLGPGRRRGTLAVHLAAAVLFTFLAMLLNFVAVNLLADGHVLLADLLGPPFRQSLVLGWRYHLLLYALVLAAAAGVESASRARAQALRDTELRTRLAAVRLETLRAQLHPHFLFNTLNGVLPLIEDDPPAAVRAVGELSALFRESLADGAPLSTVEAELRFLDRYLGLLKLRFGERLSYSLEATPEAASARVPRLLLQPLVENAVRHGLSRVRAGGRIEVDVRRVRDRLVLEVRDDGPGVSGEAPFAPGLGLSSTRARLQALHGERQTFELLSRPGGGAVAHLELPYEAAP